MSQVLILFLLLGGPGLAIGLLLGSLAASTPPRAGAVLVAGLVALAVVAVYGFDTDTPTCVECFEWHGRNYDILVPLFTAMNALGWAVGVGAGYVLRRRRARNPGRATA